LCTLSLSLSLCIPAHPPVYIHRVSCCSSRCTIRSFISSRETDART
jgi:hypothetical protein